MEHKYIQHLYWRTGFGILPAQLNTLSKKSKTEIVAHLFKASKSVTPLKVDTSEIDALFTSKSDFTKENRKKFQEISRKKRLELNVAWIGRLANTDELLREKMTLFWANHFVCEDNNILFIQQFNNTLRKHALGNFKDFVKAISKEAAMTKYLNTKQNRKLKPNENFARELMELFTLGVGNYTEQDIKESARAFTGYNHNFKGEFVLRKPQHDTGNKTFFGKTGNFDGEAIIDIILEKEQCAKYICEKIYKYFVSDVVHKGHIDEMVGVFYPNYNIEKLMRHLLLSDWFYDDENIGTKIKSPIEFLVGINGIVPVQFKNSRQLLYIQKVLGQTLLNPPNVAGWKGGRSWIDSNTIMFRLKLPSILLNNAYISKIEVDDSDSMMDMSSKNRNKKNRFKVEPNWDVFNTNFKKVSLDVLENHLLQCHINSKTEDYLQSLKKGSKRDYCIQLMSLPRISNVLVMDRRKFLKNSTLASSLFFVPSFVKAFEEVASSSLGYKRLVIVQLSGGNDGLNTVIPYRNDIYYKERPTIALSKTDVIKLNDDIGLHPSLLPLKRLYDNGNLSIINSVGYPNPVRSHFRSMDIWHTASDSNEYLQEGWIGRYLDHSAKHPYHAIELNESLSIALKGNRFNGIATQNPKVLYNMSKDPYFKNVLKHQNDVHLSEHNLGYLYKSMISAESSAKYIYETSKTVSAKDGYPKNQFGNQLKTTAQFINSGLQTKVFYASLGGFDTHANQKNAQSRLLGIYANSMEAFVSDLKENNTFKDTLILTFSEFGRRVKQNAGMGTDHGTANNVFIIGDKLKKQGFYNDASSLSDLDDNGDLKFEIDFRTIYATVLNKWLEVNDKAILNKSFKQLDFI